ncbi:MAG: 16S rRNA (cytidine(1402)-2'-O)-methyltransferase, partial [Atopobiaceae bacterium]|nr:16S rRNA (cytidine(1402)-2'-O)-methyltransferase [Atopobiaceae bacterium]
SGLPMEHFFFEGFLPRRAGEQCRRLRELALVPGALVAYESPYRVAATLANIAEVMPARQVALVRELTKLHEEVVRGAAPELAGLVAERGAIKGECVVVIGAPEPNELERRFAEMARERGLGVDAPASPDDAIREGLAAGEPKSKLAKRVAKAFGLDRAAAYDRVVELSHEAG